MKNKKAFTIVELLAVIIILGFLGSVGIIAYNTINEHVEQKYYESLETNLLVAGSEYFSSNRAERPIDAYNMVDMNVLINDKYIEQINDTNGSACDEGSVYIIANEDGTYSYEPCLKCSNFESNTTYCKGVASGVVLIEATSNNKAYNTLLSYTNTKWTNNDVVVSFKMNSNVDSYKITNNDTSEVSYCNTITSNTCSKTLSKSGVYKVEGYLNNELISATKNFNIKIDKEAPSFNIDDSTSKFVINGSGASYNYTNGIVGISDNQAIGEVKYRISATGNNGSYTNLYNSYTISSNLESNVYVLEVIVTDQAGNSVTKTKTFTIAYNIKLKYDDTNIVDFEVVKGQNYSYLSTLPTTYNGNSIKWYCDGTQITGDTTVTRNSSHILSLGTPHTITFIANGNTISATSLQCLDVTGSGCSITSPIITGNVNTPVVIGFSTSSSNNTSTWNQGTSKNITGDATYYAQTKSVDKIYIATFTANGNTVSVANVSCTVPLTYNGATPATSCSVTSPTITAPTNTPIVIGFSTAAATHSNDWSVNTAKTISSNVTYYAQTINEPSVLTLTFDPNGNTAVGETSISCTTPTSYNGRMAGNTCGILFPSITASANTPVVLGYSIKATNHTQVLLPGKTIYTGESATYYAQTMSDPKTLTATFMANGNTINDSTTSASIDCTIASTYNGVAQATSCGVTSPTITAPTNTPEVIGFSTAAATHSNDWSVNTAMAISSDVTYYAQSYKSAVNLTATYTKGTGISTLSKTSSTCTIPASYNGVAQATTCNQATPTYTLTSGCTFLGWYIGSTKVSTTTVVVTSKNETIIANAKGPILSVSISNNGSGLLTATASGGTGSFSYVWNGTTAGNKVTASTAAFNWSVTATDTLGNTGTKTYSCGGWTTQANYYLQGGSSCSSYETPTANRTGTSYVYCKLVQRYRYSANITCKQTGCTTCLSRVASGTSGYVYTSSSGATTACKNLCGSYVYSTGSCGVSSTNRPQTETYVRTCG